MRQTASSQVPFTPIRTASCILLLMFGLGLGEGRFSLPEDYSSVHVMVGLLVHYLFLLWYRSDRKARFLPRSRPMSMAVFALPLAAVPYYLLRSRAVEQRGSALAAFMGLFLLMPVAYWVGLTIHHAIRQAGA